MSDIIVNKVIKGDETYLDLTNDTVSEGTLLKNRTAHNSEGIQIQGVMEEGSGSVTGVKGDAESVYRDGNVNITAANIGTYTTSQIDALLNNKVDAHGTDSLMTNAEHIKLAGIEAGAEENVIESISLNGKEITPVNKAVALSVIDKDVNDLANYYKKSETDTSLGAKQNIILSSTLSIGGQTVTEVEEALGSLAGISKPMTGATSSSAGKGGFVPSPSAGDENKALFGDGTWKPVSGGGGGGHTILDEDGTTYPQRSKLQFEGCEVTDDAVNGITVVKCEGGGVKKYAKPVITVGTYTYDGTTQAPTITGFDANVMTLTGDYEAINAGSYTFTIALSDKTSSKWEDDTQNDIVTNWSINAISVAVPTVTETTKTYNGSAQSPTITRDTANTSISGTTSATKVKSNYSFSVALNDTTNHKWSDNTTAAKSYTWNIIPPVGSQFTPVNDIQAWLQCASIDKTYTTIAQVLADATTLSALMLSNNAVDYLVRSTSWVSNITGNQTAMTDIGASNYCADKLLANSTWRQAICDSTYFEKVLNVKVPTMTSDTTPRGVASASSVFQNGYFAYTAYHAFDKDGSSSWLSNGAISASTVSYLQYQFTSAMAVKYVEILFKNWGTGRLTGISKVRIKGSNDGTTFTTLYEYTPTDSTQGGTVQQNFIISNDDSYSYYRLETVGFNAIDPPVGISSAVCVLELNFYGRASS